MQITANPIAAVSCEGAGYQKVRSKSFQIGLENKRRMKKETKAVQNAAAFIDLDFFLFLDFSSQIFKLSEKFFFLLQLLLETNTMKMSNTVTSDRKETLSCDIVKEFVSVLNGISADTVTAPNTIKNQGNFIPFHSLVA